MTCIPWACSARLTSGIATESVSVSRPTLDDVFLTLTGRSLRDGDAT